MVKIFELCCILTPKSIIQSMKKFNVKRVVALVKCVIIFLLLLGMPSVAFSQEVTMVHDGKHYYVPKQLLDPAYPLQAVKSQAVNNPNYQNYLKDHLFPFPEDGDYERKIEIWVKNNRMFPQFLSTGNPSKDSLRYWASVDFWKMKNPKSVNFILQRKNQTPLSDADFELLYNSFPRMEHSGDAELDRRLYEEAINEWIRLYSYEKYLLIDPIVKQCEPVDFNAKEEKK